MSIKFIRNLLLHLFEFVTLYPRYHPEDAELNGKIHWSNKSWTSNVFRTYEWLFGRRVGIRREAVAAASIKDGKIYVTYEFFTLESLLNHVEGAIRRYFYLFYSFFFQQKWELDYTPIYLTLNVLGILFFLKVSKHALPLYGITLAIARDNNNVGTAVVSNTLSFSFTTSGSNTLLFIPANISTNNAGDVATSATYNSISATNYDKHVNVSTTYTGRWQYVYGLINPATGANTVAFNVSASNTIGALAASYSGCLQSGQPDSHNVGANKNITSLTVNTTVVAANCWLFGFSTGTLVRPSAGTGFNLLTNDATGNSLIGDSNGVVGTGSQGMTTTQASSAGDNGDIAMIVASFSPAASSIANRLQHLSLLGIG